MGMANLQRMAQQMQQEMLRIQGELETLTVDGSAGGGVVKAVVTGKQELVSVTIDPAAVDPADVEMLQDLIVAAVNDALRASRQVAEEKMAAVTGGLQPPRHVDHRRVPTPLIEPVARLIEAFSRLPGVGPKTAQRLTYHLLRAPDAEARALAAALVDVRDKVVFCDRCFNISDAPLCPICRDPARDVAPAVRRRGAARRPRPGADRRVQGPLPRPPRRDLADRRRRARTGCKIRELLARADEAKRDGDAVRGGHPRHEPDARGRGDGDVPRRAPRGRRSASSAGSPAACRSAATSSTPTR